MTPRPLELLSPAANADTAIQAILHSADAVYIGPPSHGARKAAANSLDDIARVTDFAHQYRAKVYATVNTIIYDNELAGVETLIRDLYHIGVDALIVQDMGILKMKLPPIALHASTQCDIRTPEKARWLEEVGFSQLVLARELTLPEIKAITNAVSVPVETFIHGALCVSYSGRCHASLALTGRSANRGECAQICRLPFTLRDAEGKILQKDRYLLSLKDFNASHRLPDLIDAGVQSFKIEGRLKDAGYVKNITSFYSGQLNGIISRSEGSLTRSSFGEVTLKFQPKPDKSFNRGFTPYFLDSRKPVKITSMYSPKSQGELIEKVSDLNNGDGISFYDRSGNFTGVNVNRVEGNKIIPARKVELPPVGKIFRTSDVKWEKIMQSETAQRKIAVDFRIDDSGLTASDERGVEVRLPLDLPYEKSEKSQDYRHVFEKLGNTIYKLSSWHSDLDPSRFYRISELTSLRRRLVELLDSANRMTYGTRLAKTYKKVERRDSSPVVFPQSLDFRDNVANRLARTFYEEHGAKSIEPAAEVSGKIVPGQTVMTTRHCILRELGLCLKEKGKPEKFRLPLYLEYDGGRFRLNFDCAKCEMQVLKSSS